MLKTDPAKALGVKALTPEQLAMIKEVIASASIRSDLYFGTTETSDSLKGAAAFSDRRR